MLLRFFPKLRGVEKYEYNREIQEICKHQHGG